MLVTLPVPLSCSWHAVLAVFDAVSAAVAAAETTVPAISAIDDAGLLQL